MLSSASITRAVAACAAASFAAAGSPRCSRTNARALRFELTHEALLALSPLAPRLLSPVAGGGELVAQVAR